MSRVAQTASWLREATLAVTAPGSDGGCHAIKSVGLRVPSLENRPDCLYQAEPGEDGVLIDLTSLAFVFNTKWV
jgi:hypothetical protein